MSPDQLPEGTKRGLLDLLVRQELTAEQLADQLGVSATAVRQHLATLSGLGLVDRRKAGTRGGRPAFLYRLSTEGRRAFPKRHDLLARELVTALIERDGEERTLEIVGEAARHLARGAESADHDPEWPRDPASPERLPAIAEWLEAEFAWEADVERLAGGRIRLVVHRCPFQAVSVDYPGICGVFFRTLLEQLTDAGLCVHRPLGDGVCCCELECASGVNTN